MDPYLIVIFGGTGDLTRRKLIPSLVEIMSQADSVGQLNLLGVGRQPHDDESFREWTRESLAETGADVTQLETWCDEHVFYQQVVDADYQALAARIEQIEHDGHLPGNRILYLALPPHTFAGTIERLGEAGLTSAPGWNRLVIEKPYGHDLESARSLNRLVHAHFAEEYVYRIDHYLGKETVRNLLAFRFANLLFESAWSRERIEAVEITVAESLGTEGRSRFYDGVGVVRDMVQNHLTQLLSLVAMEAPRAFDAEAIRSEKVEVLKSVAAIKPDRIVYGRYESGLVDGEMVPGYLEDGQVPDDSETATFVALRLAIDNWRWQGVPFYLRTGKRMPERTTEIAIIFQRPPVCLFHGVRDECDSHQNILVLTLQPDHGFDLQFDLKAPGEPLRLESVPLHFEYAEIFDTIPPAYETLLMDVIEGDQTLFVRSDEVEASWALYTPILEMSLPVLPYPAGTWGPPETNDLLGREKPWVTGG